MNYCVYRHTAPNGKVYIGLTKRSVEQRSENGNGYKHNQYFFRAIQKYGWDAFSHDILANGLTYEQACSMEREQIRLHNSTHPDYGYNIEDGGNACKALSDETKRKISEKHKGRKHGPMSDETKARLSAVRKAQGNFRTGKKLSDETRARMSKAQRGLRKPSPSDETRRKISEANSGKRRSDETRRRMSEAQKRIVNPTHLKQMKAVVQVDVENGAIINRFDSIKSAALHFGCSVTTISRVCHGKKEQYEGFKWRFAI